jgi:acetyl esterase/lipase
MTDNLNVTRRTLLAMGGTAAFAAPLATFAGAAPSAVPAAPQAGDAGGIKVEKDIVVGKGGDTDLHVDVYHPSAGTEKRMALVHLHGGGFARGSKDTLAAKVKPITQRGYVSIAAQYRLSGVAKWPAQRDDVKNAIQWTRSNANRLGIDPNRIAVVGYSAGAYLALFAAGQPENHLAACASFYAPTELAQNFVDALFGPGTDAAAVKAGNPLTYVKAGYPPTVIFQGLADTLVAPETSINLLATMRAANIPAELHTFAGVPHEFDMHPEFAESCAALIDFYLDRYVLNPRTYPPFSIPPAGGTAPAGRG